MVKKNRIESNLARLVVKHLFFISIVFTITNLGATFIGIPSYVFPIIFFVTVTYLFSVTLKFRANERVTSFMLIFVPLISLNCFFSIEPFTSAIYWLLWLMFFFSIHKVANRLTQYDLKYILSYIPYVLLLASFLLTIILYPHLTYSFTTRNSLGLLAGSSLVASLSIYNKRYRYGAALLSLFIVAISDSRSSLVFSILIASLYVLSRINKNNYGLYILGLFLIIALQAPIYNYFENKMLKKELYANNLEEALSSAQDERLGLLHEGWEVFMERPYLGYGLKTKYYEGRIFIANGTSMHVHNGYLSTLIETGLLISFFLGTFLIKLIFKVTRGIIMGKHFNDNIWYFFMAFGFLRAYGENYLFFNIGNVFSIVFLFLGVILLFNRRLSFFT